MKSKYIIVGPGASGKDWMLKKMVEMGYKPMKQYTTREKRDNETGDEYHFISDEEFRYMDDRAHFISANFYRIGWYAVSYDELMASDVAILSPANVKDIFDFRPELREQFIIIYLDMPESLRRERLNKRYSQKVGDNNEERLAADRKDFQDFTLWDLRLGDEKSVNTFINIFVPPLGGIRV